MTKEASNPPEQASAHSFDWKAARGDTWSARLGAMEAMLEPVDAPLIRALALDHPCRIADLACGGGGTSLAVLQRAPTGSTVHGLDISPALIAAARARVPPGERAITFTQADLATVTSSGVPYERLVSRFGVMFFEDPPAAFRNIVRLLAPGGRLAFAVWGPPADNPWVTELRDVVAELVHVPPLVPDAIGPFRYAVVDRLLALLADAGCGALEVQDWRGMLPVGGGLPAEEAAAFALSSFSFADAITEVDAEVRAKAQRNLAARYAKYEQGGIVRIDARVHIVVGAKTRG